MYFFCTASLEGLALIMTALLISLCCVVCLALVIVSVHVLLLYCFTGRCGSDHDCFVDQSVLCHLSVLLLYCFTGSDHDCFVDQLVLCHLSGSSDCLCVCTSSVLLHWKVWL